jgi:hypothetical protein
MAPARRGEAHNLVATVEFLPKARHPSVHALRLGEDVFGSSRSQPIMDAAASLRAVARSSRTGDSHHTPPSDLALPAYVPTAYYTRSRTLRAACKRLDHALGVRYQTVAEPFEPLLGVAKSIARGKVLGNA